MPTAVLRTVQPGLVTTAGQSQASGATIQRGERQGARISDAG
jgi:hypothetical protein